MIDIVNCPSNLAEGFSTYSPKARKALFDGRKISHLLDFNVDEFHTTGEVAEAMHRSDVFERTGHPCRLDFERFGVRIGILESRVSRILDKYMLLPQSSLNLIGRSFLNDKARRHYLRIVNERIVRFTRTSD